LTSSSTSSVGRSHPLPSMPGSLIGPI
jgi:hypothetical protein